MSADTIEVLAKPGGWRREVASALATAALLTLCGAPMGLLWGWLSPHLNISAVIAGSESAFSVQFDQDLVLLAVGLLVGVGAGLLALRAAKGHLLGAAVGLAVGGVLAGLIAATVGDRFRMPALLHYIKPGLDPQTRAQTVALIGFRLRVGAFALALPAAALLTVIIRLLSTDDTDGPTAGDRTRAGDGRPMPSLAHLPDGSPADDRWWSAPR